MKLQKSIEWHDSEIVSLEVDASFANLKMRASLHVSEGEPGVAAGEVWTQIISVCISNPEQAGSSAKGEWVSEGTLTLDGTSIENMISVPFEFSGKVCLRLLGPSFEVTLRGTGIEIVEVGKAKYLQAFPG